MATVVEFVGPPGVGKSTLLAALTDRRLPDGRRLVPAGDLLHPPRPGLPRRLGRRLPRTVPPARRRELVAARTEWEPFQAHVLTSGPGGPPLRRLLALSYTLATLELLALAQDHDAPVVVLLDEGPLQRALTLLGPAAGDDEVERHVATAPVTDRVLNLRVDVSMLERRLTARDRVTDRHAGLGPDALRAAVAEEIDLLDRVATAARTQGRSVTDVDVVAGRAAADAVVRLLAGTVAP